MSVKGLLLHRGGAKLFSRFLSIPLLGAVCQNAGPAKPIDPGISSPRAPEETNSFPSLAEIFQGRAFETTFEREVYFLKAIRDHYPQHWLTLLAANINLEGYLKAPSKFLRFVEELGAAMANRNDLAATTNLTLIISDEAFYANTNEDMRHYL
jgi:hypothetical protein